MTAPDLPVLYSFRRCPYAMRARMALSVAGLAYQTVEVSLKAKPPELLAISPKGTVPVMLLQDGAVLEQSLDIMRWALAQNLPHSDPEDWLGADTPEVTTHWLEACDITFKPLLDRYKYADRHPDKTPEQHRANAMNAFIIPLEVALKAKLGEHRELGQAYRPRLWEVAVFPFVRQFAAVDRVWFDAQPLPVMHTWLARWLTSDLFATIMKK